MHIQSKTVITSGVLAGSLVLFTGCGSHTADDAVMGGAAGAGAGALIGGPAGAGIGGAIGAGTGAIIGAGQDKQDREDGVEYEKPF
ncbi:MAG: hypothetical protein MK095_07575 [Phycisphaerales bacterium]|nr:hypothetical protein [Phycisphaerales bacterium]